MALKVYRLRELDFLRGTAIILVLFRHQSLFLFPQTMGWIGVDLFFVLSGFLVSGLLFKEFLKFGDIKPLYFLIRRGFKIYPTYYLFYLPYLFLIIANGSLNIKGFLSDLFFLQNYVSGWGYSYEASWSLAVEEHFYFGFSLTLWFLLRKKLITLMPPVNTRQASRIEMIILYILVGCFILRIVSNLAFADQHIRNFSMTHLRIDSLVSGVLVSYWYHFRLELLKNIFNPLKHYLLVFSFGLLAFTPFFEPFSSFFVKTIGFSMLYISFGILLLYFLLDEKINLKLNLIFSPRIVTIISKIGYCSYSIYIIHTFIYKTMAVNGFSNNYFNFAASFSLSILCGILMTYLVEKNFLKIREKYYPNRII
jgi:peptidoglycan/LPS O-acetylase OafA/YrhL